MAGYIFKYSKGVLAQWFKLIKHSFASLLYLRMNERGNKMKKRFIALMLIMCLVITLTACGTTPVNSSATPGTKAASSDTPAATAPIELTLATSLYVEEPHQKALDNLLAAYNKKNPNVKITIYGAEYANFWNNLTTEIISNNEADIVQIGPDRLTSYNALRKGGSFVDLGPYIAKSGKDYAKLLVGQNDTVVDGKTLALSNYAWGTTGIFYRKSILEKAGINPDSIKTSDDFVAALKATTKGDVVGMGVVVGTHSFVVSEWIRMFNRGVTGGVYFDKEMPPYDADHIVVNNDANVYMAKWWQDLILKDKVLKPGPDKKDSRELFWNGLAAFNLDGPWFIGMTESRDPKILADTGLIPHPEMIYNGKSYKATPSYSPYLCSISTNCKHPQEAWDFMEWMTSVEAQTIIATCGMTPSNTEFSGTDSYKTNYPLAYKFSGFLTNNYGPLMKEPTTPKYAELLNVLIDSGQNMFSEKGADPKAELDAAAAKMKEIMKK